MLCTSPTWDHSNRDQKQVIRVARGSTGIQLILPDSDTSFTIEPPAESQSIIANLFQQASDTNVASRPAIGSDGRYIYVLSYNHAAATSTIAKIGSGHYDTISGKVYNSMQVQHAQNTFDYLFVYTEKSLEGNWWWHVLVCKLMQHPNNTRFTLEILPAMARTWCVTTNTCTVLRTRGLQGTARASPETVLRSACAGGRMICRLQQIWASRHPCCPQVVALRCSLSTKRQSGYGIGPVDYDHVSLYWAW